MNPPISDEYCSAGFVCPVDGAGDCGGWVGDSHLFHNLYQLLWIVGSPEWCLKVYLTFSHVFSKSCFACSPRGLSVDSLFIWTCAVSSLVSSPGASLAWFSVVFVNTLVERLVFGLYYSYFNYS